MNATTSTAHPVGDANLERHRFDSSLPITPELAQRIEHVERVLLADFGSLHVPNAQQELRYFANEYTARIERRREAERRVREHDRRLALQRQRAAAFVAEVEAAAAAQPSLRQLAIAQREHYEATGELIVGDDVSSEPLSYGVRCSGCGEWVTACMCPVVADLAV